MVPEVICNWIALGLIISFAFNVVQFTEWYDKHQAEKRIKENKRRGNHFKEVR